MLMRVTPVRLARESKFEDKPGKYEIPKYFKVCRDGCVNCDTKRISGCNKPN